MVPFETPPRRILVVDDNVEIHNDFRLVLLPGAAHTDLNGLEADVFGSARPVSHSYSYEIDFTFQGGEAVEKVHQARASGRPFALAFVDMRMPPGWNGLETTARLWEADPYVQVVLCTAYSDHSWEEIAAQFPNTDGLLILKKPFAREEVAQLAKTLTQKWVLAQQAALRMSDLEEQVAARTEDLRRACHQLQQDIHERQRAEEDRRRLEEQLRQAQRMEAIGHLAGGVAHDLNNFLTPIVGYADLLLSHFGPDSPAFADVEQILKAASCARGLTQQLLAFGRKQVLEARVLDLNSLLRQFVKMLSRLIGEHIEIVLDLEPDLVHVCADPSQIHQITVNLAVNARDAMPKGGRLILHTANVHLDEGFSGDPIMAHPGDYALLKVTDTGCGMDSETLSHVFEPFFTTKDGGTGLGLSTVYGIAHQHGGAITVDSRPGTGSSFSLYLPRVDEPVEQQDPDPAVEFPPTGNESILVVEDSDMVRHYAAHALQSMGYTVLDAFSPHAALALLEHRSMPIDLLLTDVVLPQMSGKDLYRELSSTRPGLKVLYMSAYPHGVIAQHGILDAGIRLLPKPFNVAELVRKVREALAAPI